MRKVSLWGFIISGVTSLYNLNHVIVSYLTFLRVS